MDASTLDGNIDAIERYIREGEAGRGGSGLLGFELEHFVVDARTNALVPYASSPEYSRPGVKDVLARLSPLYEGESRTADSNGCEHIVGLVRNGAPITIEPGAQIEVSIGPCRSIAQIEERYRRFRSKIDAVLDEMGYRLATLGYHPTACACDIPLIPKRRYTMMDERFRSTGSHGICMMRGSASTQVSIDYDDEADAVAKMQVATAIGPLLYFVLDNAPVFEGERVGVVTGDAVAAGSRVSQRSGLAIPQRMARAAIWNDVDADRAMGASFLFESDPGYRSYATMLMARPPILALERPGDDSSAVWHGSEPASQVFAGKTLTRSDIEHILSMFFFDVRLKQYIEIRQPDSMPIEYGLAFAAMVRGIFYGKGDPADGARALTPLAKLHDELEAAGMFSPDGPTMIAQAKADLASHGYEANVYGRSAAGWLDELLALAREGLQSLAPAAQATCSDPSPTAQATCSTTAQAAPDSAYLEPLAALISHRTTLVEHPSV